jgi:hypothetical protein
VALAGGGSGLVVALLRVKIFCGPTDLKIGYYKGSVIGYYGDFLR